MNLKKDCVARLILWMRSSRVVKDYYSFDSSGAEEQTALLCGGARLPVSSPVCSVPQESSEANTSGKPEHSGTLLFVMKTQLRVKLSLSVQMQLQV